MGNDKIVFVSYDSPSDFRLNDGALSLKKRVDKETKK